VTGAQTGSWLKPVQKGEPRTGAKGLTPIFSSHAYPAQKKYLKNKRK
jgi:hypothetical protein